MQCWASLEYFWRYLLLIQQCWSIFFFFYGSSAAHAQPTKDKLWKQKTNLKAIRTQSSINWPQWRPHAWTSSIGSLVFRVIYRFCFTACFTVQFTITTTTPRYNQYQASFLPSLPILLEKNRPGNRLGCSSHKTIRATAKFSKIMLSTNILPTNCSYPGQVRFHQQATTKIFPRTDSIILNYEKFFPENYPLYLSWKHTLNVSNTHLTWYQTFMSPPSSLKGLGVSLPIRHIPFSIWLLHFLQELRPVLAYSTQKRASAITHYSLTT